MGEIVKEGPEEYNKISFFGYKIKKDKFVLIISIFSAIILFYFGILFQLYLDYFTLSALILVVFSTITLPYTFYKALEGSIVKKIKENYPSFLRDLSEALSSGMTIVQALRHVSEVDYGPLTKFIKKLYAWLSWGMEFSKAFEKFNMYFEDLPEIKRANYIILEAYISGGNIDKVLKTVANDLESIQELNKLRSAYVSQQVLVLYVVYFVFIGLMIMLKEVLEPLIFQQNLLQIAEQTFSFVTTPVDFGYFKFIATLAIIIEGILIAFIIGVSETGEVKRGFKHLPITLISAIIAVLIFILPEKVSITISVYPSSNIYIGQKVNIEVSISVDANPVDNEVVMISIHGPETYTKIITLDKGKATYVFEPQIAGEYNIIAHYTKRNKEYRASYKIIVT